MNLIPLHKQRGLTLIELIVALVVGVTAIAGIYQMFIVQSRAYVVQDQVIEVQQNIRSAMEILVRDIRMAGFDYDNSTSSVKIEDFKPGAPYLVSGNSITVWYEIYRPGPPLVSEVHEVRYALNNTDLERRLNINGVTQLNEVLLENVVDFELTCGIDGRIGFENTQDGIVDQWVNCATVNNNQDKVIAVRVALTTRPAQNDAQDDRFQNISPRTLNSTIALRNLSIKKL